MVKESAEKDYGIDESPSSSEVPENKLRHNFRLGDITWVKRSSSSWWPAQVADESCVGGKPKEAKHDCLVRLYGTCQYMYVDPWKSNTEFEMMLKQENKTAMEAFHEVLEKKLSHVDLSSDDDEEAANSKGGGTKVTFEKTSSRKVKKGEGLKQCSHRGVKESATAKNQGDETEQQYNEEEDQAVGSTATTGVTARKRKSGRARQSSSTRDKEQAIKKASTESSAEGFLRDKRQKHAAQGTSVGRREGLRRSGRSSANGYLDAADDKTAPLTGIGASEDAMVDETSASHTEIKAMVRDILFKEIIDREHDAEMAFVDEVINGICNATEDNVTGGATASRKGERDAKQSGRRVETAKNDDSKGNNSNPLEGIIDNTPSRDAAAMEPGQLNARQIRQLRIMQNLGLIAPSGSPFGGKGVVASTD